MATQKFTDTAEFKKGRSAELMVANWLREFGWYVIPSYDYSGADGDKAPKLQGKTLGFPVPDLDVAKAGARKWVEVKAKAKPDWTRITKRFEHGIEHYDDYVRVAEETGTEAWLAIYEECTGELLMQSFKDLGAPRRSTYLGKRMAFWARDAFEVITRFDTGESG